MKKTRILALILAGLLLTSCGSSQTNDNIETDTADTAADTIMEENEAEYVFPELDCKGEKFTILNDYTDWNFTTTILVEESTGDTLNDTILNANLRVEEEFNVDLAVYEVLITDMINFYMNSVMAGEDAYKYAITPCKIMGNPDAYDAVMELTQFDELHLDKPWWDQNVAETEQLVTGDKLYFAANDINLIAFEDSMCLFMNEDMIKDNGLDPIYDLVREGTWTFDVFRQYAETGANLNGADSFTFKLDGEAIYGLTTWTAAVHAFLHGMGNIYIDMGENGIPTLNTENDRFYTSVEKLAAFHGTEGACLDINKNAAEHYEEVFRMGRAMFTCAQLKASTKYREVEFTYGIVPMPKFDEAQEEYHNYRTTNVQLTSIPVTNPKAEETAVILDAMAYLAYSEILPTYWNVNMEHKQLRNEDSIEMLEIISRTRSFNMGAAFTWTSSMTGKLESTILSGSSDVASLIAGFKDSIEQSIKDSLDLMAE